MLLKVKRPDAPWIVEPESARGSERGSDQPPTAQAPPLFVSARARASPASIREGGRSGAGTRKHGPRMRPHRPPPVGACSSHHPFVALLGNVSSSSRTTIPVGPCAPSVPSPAIPSPGANRVSGKWSALLVLWLDSQRRLPLPFPSIKRNLIIPSYANSHSWKERASPALFCLHFVLALFFFLPS